MISRSNKILLFLLQVLNIALMTAFVSNSAPSMSNTVMDVLYGHSTGITVSSVVLLTWPIALASWAAITIGLLGLVDTHEVIAVDTDDEYDTAVARFVMVVLALDNMIIYFAGTDYINWLSLCVASFNAFVLYSFYIYIHRQQLTPTKYLKLSVSVTAMWMCYSAVLNAAIVFEWSDFISQCVLAAALFPLAGAAYKFKDRLTLAILSMMPVGIYAYSQGFNPGFSIIGVQGGRAAVAKARFRNWF